MTKDEWILLVNAALAATILELRRAARTSNDSSLDALADYLEALRDQKPT